LVREALLEGDLKSYGVCFARLDWKPTGQSYVLKPYRHVDLGHIVRQVVVTIAFRRIDLVAASGRITQRDLAEDR
jgi:hypothetical protein